MVLKTAIYLKLQVIREIKILQKNINFSQNICRVMVVDRDTKDLEAACIA